MNFVPSLRTPPFALFVPAAISTWYVVACGNRTSGSNSSVRVPIQRHVPFGVGTSFTGTLAAASSCDVTATIGCENVTLSSGAYGTLPSGMNRSTRRSFPASLLAGGRSDDGGGGNAPLIVCPVRGGGCDRSRSANACWSTGSVAIGLARESSACASASGRCLAGARFARSKAGAPCLPSLTRRSSPGGRSLVWISTWSASGEAPPVVGPVFGRPPQDVMTNGSSVAAAMQRRNSER